ncbi:hypothetical protein QU487_06675 [Crenobacter sp. SG2305]|uniref:hypothetical protein n=1 Tax=Crenobacter oryzisoli TaxID=3056844 RepID=UPI0025AAD05A|nr:hypothetical protein [Crenobacter sp. SG2305]MDN0082438.1 hypothetical protein [Crenobacter sp. SG2305]
MSINFTDTTWDDSGLTAADMMVLGITREEIESQNISKALSRLMMLSDQQVWTEKFNGGLLFFIAGYDHDRRDLAEIAEVRAYMQRLTSEWPFWIHFLAQHDQIMLVLRLLCDVEILAQQNGAVGTRFKKPEQLEANFRKLFDEKNRLLDCYGIAG